MTRMQQAAATAGASGLSRRELTVDFHFGQEQKQFSSEVERGSDRNSKTEQLGRGNNKWRKSRRVAARGRGGVAVKGDRGGHTERWKREKEPAGRTLSNTWKTRKKGRALGADETR